MASEFKSLKTLYFLSFLCLPVSLLATDRFYPDLNAFSENGKFKLIAQSPDNSRVGMARKSDPDPFGEPVEPPEGNPKLKPFSDHFEYILLELEGEEKTRVWQRRPKPADFSPLRIMVNNQGWSVIYDENSFLVIDPTGRDRGRVLLYHDVFSKQEEDDYISSTTGGRFWQQSSLWYFLPESSEGQFFVIRTWWGKRIIVDLKSADIVADHQRLNAAVNVAEAKFIHETLIEAARELPVIAKKETCCCEEFNQIERYKAAILFSPRVNLKPKVLPLLRQLEKVEYQSSFGGHSMYDAKEGEPDPGRVSENSIRQQVHLALRRLGEKPKVFPCVKVRIYHKKYKPEYFLLPEVTADQRAERVGQIKPGMKPAELFQLMGGPDFQSGAGLCYDIDAPEPYTLSIYFDKGGVTRKFYGYPAGWQLNNEREALMVR